MSWTERFEVRANCDGWRLDLFLAHSMRRASRAKVARIIRAAVRIDGRAKVKPGTIVRTGDIVFVDRVERADPAAPPLESVGVIHQSETLVVLHKPPGMLVHRTAHEATTTIDAYLAHAYPGERVEPVHRLDRDTSGVLLCGRGLDAVRELVAVFETGAPAKRYDALVDDPDLLWRTGDERTFDTPLGFDSESEVKIRIGRGDWDCATHATCTGRVGQRATLSVRIDRGRQHQIRAHLAMFGTPVVGDKLYGLGDAFFQEWVVTPGAEPLVAALPTRWHCLHAAELELPFQGECWRWSAGPPPWMAEP